VIFILKNAFDNSCIYHDIISSVFIFIGSMTSSTVFGGTRAMTAASLDDDSIQMKPKTNTLGEILSPTKGETVEIYQKMHVSRSSINVYDQVLVCLFCSQFFQSQEEYRPSYAEMVHSEKRASHLEALERERQYWDPLKMVFIYICIYICIYIYIYTCINIYIHAYIYKYGCI
jgi:hypothetical protein